MGREDQYIMRLIKEAICIRINSPSLNKDKGKYHLPHIWYEILFYISELKKNKIIDTMWPINLLQRQHHLHELKHFTPCGYSICHNGHNICNLPHICGHNIYHNGFPSATHITHKGGNNICHKIHDTTSVSATMAITSVINVKLICN